MSEHEPGRAEFFQAVDDRDLALVRALAAGEPALAAARRDGATALHFAAIRGDEALADVLVELGSDLNDCDDEFGAKPAGWANEAGHSDLVAHLVARGTNAALFEAAGWGLTDRVKALLADGSVDVDRSYGFGTALHNAALWGHDEIVRLLLAAGADPTRPNPDGLTAHQLAQSQIDYDADRTPVLTSERQAELVKGCRRVIAELTRV